MFYLTPLKIILKSFLPDAMYANIIVSYSKCRPLHQTLCKAALSGWLAGKIILATRWYFSSKSYTSRQRTDRHARV